MPIPVAAIANAAKTGLDLIKQNEGSSSNSSIANVKQYETAPTEIKRTEGDLGFDDKDSTSAATPQQADYTEQFEKPEIANIENPNRPEAIAEVPDVPLTKDAFESLFNVSNGVPSESGETDSVNTSVNEGGNAQYVEDSQGTDSTFRSSPLGTESAVPISNNQEVGELSIPQTNAEQPTKETQSEETSLLDEAKEANKDGDIDDKELPIAENEQAAEDIEDLVEDETKSDEEKEEILEKAADDGKIEDGEVAEEAGNTNEEEQSEETNPIDKGKELLDKILPYLKHDSSSSASSSISGGGAPEVEGVAFKASSIADDVAQLLGGDSTAANIDGQGNISSIANPDYKQSIASTVAEKGATGSNASVNAADTTSTATSSGSGPIAKAFNDMINSKGASYTSSGGESRFGSNLDNGGVKSVSVKPSEGLKLNNAKAATANAANTANPYDAIRAEIIENSKDWKERNGLRFKDKGSLLILTDGKDVKIKMGTRRLKDLDEIPVDKLDYIEEVI